MNFADSVEILAINTTRLFLFSFVIIQSLAWAFAIYFSIQEIFGLQNAIYQFDFAPMK